MQILLVMNGRFKMSIEFIIDRLSDKMFNLKEILSKFAFQKDVGVS